MSQESSGCKDCKRFREHLASILPFKVLESVADKPLRIGGVAMAVGMSRNFNVYTPEELQAFADKLVNAPVYIEHVAVDSAAGKVTKCTYDSASRCLLYEAEIYDQTISDKIRNGLIQHVSVGADYDALDVVDAKVPHGLFNPELSLVAVPGIPETNVQVLEHLATDKRVVESLKEKEMDLIAEKVVLKIGEKSSLENEKMKTELNEAKSKLAESEGKVKCAETARNEADNKLVVANKTVEKLRKLIPAGLELLVDPPVLMPVVEHIAILEKRLPSTMAERSSLGLQLHAQEMRGAIMQAKERLKVK
jgi:hypothetical protein